MILFCASNAFKNYICLLHKLSQGPMGSTDYKRTSEKRRLVGNDGFHIYSIDSSENSPLSLICNLNIPTRGDRKGMGMRQVKHGANSSSLVDCPARFETVRELLCCHESDKTSSAVQSYSIVVVVCVCVFFFQKV